MTKFLLIVPIVLLIFAFFTNPTIEEHKEQVSKKLLKEIDQKEKKKNVFVINPMAEIVTNEVVQDAVHVKDYKIFSLTQYKTKDQPQVIAIGAFGKLFFIKDTEDFIPNPTF